MQPDPKLQTSTEYWVMSRPVVAPEGQHEHEWQRYIKTREQALATAQSLQETYPNLTFWVEELTRQPTIVGDHRINEVVMRRRVT